MRKHFKGLVALGLIACLSVSSSMTSLAGQWQEDAKGRWYQNDDGSYPVNTWKEIDGAFYHFDNDGYLSTNEGFSFITGTDGAWIPEGNDVNGKENALTIVEDMGLTYGELKAKYGDYDSNNIQKFLYLQNGALSEYDETEVNLSDVMKILLEQQIRDGGKHGKSVLFVNSSVKFQENGKYIPNYSFLSDSDGNISDDSKPIRIIVAAKKLFPNLTPLSTTEEMANQAEEMGAINVEWESDLFTFINEWKGNTLDGHYYSNIKFELGDCLFQANNPFIDKIGLDNHISVKRE